MRISAIITQIDNLRACERILHRIAEAECNGDLSTRQVKRRAKYQAEATESVRRLSVETGQSLKVRFNGDPRGSAIKLTNADEAQDYNDLGSEISI